MLGAEKFEYTAEEDDSPQIPGVSPVTDFLGLDNVRVSKDYPRGSLVFVEGQQPLGIYLLCEGRAKVSIASAEGKIFVLRIAEAGELLGINATLTGLPYRATVETLQNCRIDFVSREDLLKLLDRDKRAYLALTTALIRKLTGLVDHTRLLFLSRSTAEKLARLLVKWCDETGKQTSGGTQITPGLTHEEMGQMISVSRETVTRELNTLKKKHIVQIQNGGILVRNQAALIALANFGG